MPRYHFNTCNGHAMMDKQGVMLSGQLAARGRAIQLFDALLASDAARLQLGEDWRMEVTDDDGRLLFRLDFTVLKFRQPSDVLELQRATT
ncbi:DUF6894 family protein [Lichenihabitans psoromatis]|uniref:DUF6894 family protein n=1 Tax=Lichenihabitans psoromatis TaxID=2528642 RepID=UPI0010360C42|nr:hypothetical protein [Lichenihabitans psoromatis]